MHSFIVAGLFILMVLAPCFFAQCYGIFPFRIKVRWVRPPAPVKRIDPLLLATRKTRANNTAPPQTGLKLAPVRRMPEPEFAAAYESQPDFAAPQSLLE